MLRSLFQVAGEDWGQSLKWCLFLHVTFALREASDLWASSSCLLQCGFCDVLGLDCQTWVSTLKNCGLQACFLHVNFNWKIGCKSQVCKLTKWLQSWKCPSIWTVFYRLGSKLQYLIRFALPIASAGCLPRQVSHDPPLRWPAFCNAHGRHLRHPYICTCSSKWKWELAAGRLQRFVVS